MRTSKICNIIMFVINILNLLINMGIGLDAEIAQIGLTMFSLDILVNLTLWGGNVFLPICNLVMLIINIKDKKLRFFYMLLLISSLDNIFVLLDFSEDIEIILGIIIAIIILIHNLVNNEGKRRIIYSISTIILAILFVVLTTNFIGSAYIQLSFIGVLLVLLIKTKVEDKTKIQKILSIIIVSIASILTIVLFANYKIIEISMKNKSEIIINYVKNADVSNENYTPICKNGKWGYVDSKGNVKIDYQYDKASVMDKICLKNNNLHIVNLAIVKKQDIYIVINQDNEKILEINTNKKVEDVINGYLSTGINSTVYGILGFFKISEELNMPEIEYGNNIYKPYNKVFAESNGVYQLEISNKQYNISKKETEQINKPILNLPNNTNIYRQYNDIKYKISDSIEEKEIEINSQESEDGQIYLGLYSDGYIPYYNLEEKRQGYYDENLNLKLISGNYEILDIKQGYTLLRYFDDNYKQQAIIVINSNGQKVKQFKQIQTLENGYIAKKDNSKIVFLDNEFNELSDEYDSIYSENDFYIMGKIQNSKVIYYMIDKNNYQILNKDIETFLCGSSQESEDGIWALGSLDCQGTYLLDNIYNIEY